MNINDIYFGTGLSSAKDYEGLLVVLDAAIENGIRYFDTAPSYRTEEILGRAIKELAAIHGLSREEYHIQTKIDPWQMQAGNIRSFVEDAMSKLRVDYIDSLIVHWFVPDYFDDTWAEFESMYEDGIVKRIGVSNVRERQLRRVLQCNIPPQIVQIERNPLRTCDKEVTLCHEHGIEVQAYSALCKMDARIRDNVAVREIAKTHNKSVGQTVLRWHIDTGVIPIFTSKKTARIKEYTEIFDFELSKQEVKTISSLNENYKIYLESCVCPGF